LQVVGLCPTPHKLFEKSLIKNFTIVGFILLLALTIVLPKPRVRWPRQDDGAASGCRAALVRVKPDKHRPVSDGRGRSYPNDCWAADKGLVGDDGNRPAPVKQQTTTKQQNKETSEQLQATTATQ
jgi:hypothetical protein